MTKEGGKRRRRKGIEGERGADPDPVTEAGDGITKSNPPSKIESHRGSVYLMKEKRRQRILLLHRRSRGSTAYKKRRRWTGMRGAGGGKKDENK